MHQVHIEKKKCPPVFQAASLHQLTSLLVVVCTPLAVNDTRLKFGERLFSCAGPRAWNSLPPSLHELTNTNTFKRHLKAFLFQQAYSCWLGKFSRWRNIAKCISPAFYAYICIYMCFWFLMLNWVLLYDYYFSDPSHTLCVYMCKALVSIVLL